MLHRKWTEYGHGVIELGLSFLGVKTAAKVTARLAIGGERLRALDRGPNECRQTTSPFTLKSGHSA